MLLPEQLNKLYMQVYPEADRLSKVFLNMKTSGEQEWPDWCYLPVAASYAIVSGETEKQGVAMELGASDIGNLAAILAWRPTKGVYRFDDDLLKSLWDVKLDKDIPVDVLFNLPEWCCYIDLETFPPAIEIGLSGFFVYLESDANTGGREIRLTFAREDEEGKPGIMTLPFHIDNEKKIGDMLQSTVDFSSPHHDDVLKKIGNIIRDDEKGLLNFAESSYINSQNKEQKKYIMDRKSFSVLCMSFTGKKALAWKIKFYDAFEAMEKALLQQAAQNQNEACLPDELKSLKDKQVPHKEAVEMYGRYFSLILYLCSEHPDIIQTSRVRKAKNTKNPKKQKRKLPVEYRVGSSIGSAIRRARGRHQGTGTGPGTSKAPHIRRAHYHTFWTGKSTFRSLTHNYLNLLIAELKLSENA